MPVLEQGRELERARLRDIGEVVRHLRCAKRVGLADGAVIVGARLRHIGGHLARRTARGRGRGILQDRAGVERPALVDAGYRIVGAAGLRDRAGQLVAGLVDVHEAEIGALRHGRGVVVADLIDPDAGQFDPDIVFGARLTDGRGVAVPVLEDTCEIARPALVDVRGVVLAGLEHDQFLTFGLVPHRRGVATLRGDRGVPAPVLADGRSCAVVELHHIDDVRSPDLAGRSNVAVAGSKPGGALIDRGQVVVAGLLGSRSVGFRSRCAIAVLGDDGRVGQAGGIAVALIHAGAVERAGLDDVRIVARGREGTDGFLFNRGGVVVTVLVDVGIIVPRLSDGRGVGIANLLDG